jgi:hypothetical protein
MNLPTKTIAVAAGALLLAGTTATAASAAKPRIDLRGEGLGSFVLDDAGTAHLGGEVTGIPFGGAYTATLAAADGSLPEPGTCEPASGTLEVDGPRRKHLELAAAGEVCGEWTDATYVVTHRFTGGYEVVASSKRRLLGTDGWISLVLATEGRANVEVFDS